MIAHRNVFITHDSIKYDQNVVIQDFTSESWVKMKADPLVYIKLWLIWIKKKNTILESP